MKLTPGSNASLTKENPLLDDIVVGFGWSITENRGPQIELVPAAIITDDDDKALSDDHFLFFNQLSAADGSVQYVEGDDIDQIEISLKSIPEDVKKIVFIVYVDPDLRSPGNFGSVKDPYIRIFDRSHNEIVRFDLTPDKDDRIINSKVFGELYRHRTEWKFRALGQGYSTGISGVAKDYSVTL